MATCSAARLNACQPRLAKPVAHENDSCQERAYRQEQRGRLRQQRQAGSDAKSSKSQPHPPLLAQGGQPAQECQRRAQDGCVVVIDSGTGNEKTGRRGRDGRHQHSEARAESYTDPGEVDDDDRGAAHEHRNQPHQVGAQHHASIRPLFGHGVNGDAVAEGVVGPREVGVRQP
jgi:hypothetical protein